MAVRPSGLIEVAPGVRRITANNPGPFTFAGTNTYVVGNGSVGVIDPGPDDPAHVDSLLRSLGAESVTHIFLTHRHQDHVGGLRRLNDATGGMTAAAPAPKIRGLPTGGIALEGPADARPFHPDVVLADGSVIATPGWRIETVATPGHASDHLAFAVPEAGIIFSGDHVMGWSSSIVAPPDGNMAAYMRSLEKIAARPERRYLPGHGDPVADGPARVGELIAHRRGREAAIIDRLRKGDTRIADIVAAIYRDTDRGLHAAAALSVLAHLEELVARGFVVSEGQGLDGSYRLTEPR